MQEEFYKLPWNTNEDSNFVNESYLKTHSSTYKILHGTLQKVFSSDSEAEDGKTIVKETGQLAEKRTNRGYIPGYFDETKIKYAKSSALNKNQQAMYVQLMIKSGIKHSNGLTTDELKHYQLLHEKVKKERYEFINFVKQRCAVCQDRYLLCNPDVRKFVEELWQHRLAQIDHYPANYESFRILPLVYSDARRRVLMTTEKTLLELMFFTYYTLIAIATSRMQYDELLTAKGDSDLLHMSFKDWMSPANQRSATLYSQNQPCFTTKGSVPYVIWPKFNNCVTVITDYSRMVTKYPPEGRDNEHSNVKLHKEQVSEDKNAEKLAVSYEADIVITANALKNIADNHGPSFERNWDIPVHVRECIDPETGASRKVVFVDKPLAPSTLNTAEKNLWYYRIAVKPLICHKKHPKILQLAGIQQCASDAGLCEARDSKSPAKSRKRKREAVQSDVTDSDDKLVISFSDSETSPTQSRITRSRTRLISMSETSDMPDKHMKNLVISENSIKCEQKPVETNSDWILPPMGSNVSYRLWKLHKEEFNKDDMKGNFLKGDNTNREIKLLIRCKVDGYENENNTVYVVPKVEYQTEYGAECLTKSEITQQWISLFVRPGTTLCRVRVNICTSEVIMIQRRSLQELVQESIQHVNSPVSTVLGTLYNILLGLVDLEAGSYLLSHTPQLGAFVSLRTSDGIGRYNLHDMYRVDPSAEPMNDKFVWNPIDHTIVTPYHQAMNRVPGTFPPVLFFRGKPKMKKKKKKKKGSQQKGKAKQ